MAKLGALAGMQEVDYASALRSTLPVADHGDLSSADGPMLISFVVISRNLMHGGVALGEIQSKVNTWTGSIELRSPRPVMRPLVCFHIPNFCLVKMRT